MCNDTKFELHALERLTAQLGHPKAQVLWAGYTSARAKVSGDILTAIQGAQPNLSDHGPEHVAHVLENAGCLLSENSDDHGLTGMDLYCLAMTILFHDVGNLFGRKEHHKKLGEIFDWARGTDAAVRREKTLVTIAARAHTGEGSDGTADTLVDVPERDHMYGQLVRLREVAAVLRLADELAEGPRRTSEYRRRKRLIAVSSRIFHDYASATNITIDRGTQRILLTYEIEIPRSTKDKNAATRDRARFKGFLRYVYERAVKLDQERRYGRFYSTALSPFKTTHIAFNFHSAGRVLPTDLQPLILDDKVVPGENTRPIPDINPAYSVARLMLYLQKIIRRERHGR